MNWSEMTKKQKGIVIVVLIIIAILAIFGFISNGGVSSSGSSKTCGVCHRSYSDSSNTRSIALRGMCEHCYNDYKWAKEGMEGLGQ